MKNNFDNLFKNASDTKEKLILLALKSYQDTGAHLTNFQNLARELDINQSALYRHFDNKEQLIIESLKYAAIKGREFIDQDEDPALNALKRFEFYIQKNIEYSVQQRIFSVSLITLHYFATCLPEVKKLHEEINERRIKKISGFIFQAIHEKAIPKTNVEKKSELIHSLLMGEMIKAHLWPKEKSIDLRTKDIFEASRDLLKI